MTNLSSIVLHSIAMGSIDAAFAAEIRPLGKFKELFPNAYSVVHVRDGVSREIWHNDEGKFPAETANPKFKNCLVIGSSEERPEGGRYFSRATVIERDGAFEIPLKQKGGFRLFIVKTEDLLRAIKDDVSIVGVPAN